MEALAPVYQTVAQVAEAVLGGIPVKEEVAIKLLLMPEQVAEAEVAHLEVQLIQLMLAEGVELEFGGRALMVQLMVETVVVAPLVVVVVA